MTFDSIAESASASTIAKLGGKRCTSFGPYQSDFYQDASGEDLEGKPDFVFQRPHGLVFMEFKAGALNNHYTRESSRAALANEYMYLFHRLPDGMSHAELSKVLHTAPGRTGSVAALEHGFNHSLWKLVAMQAHHGWRRYIVCFQANPKPADAKRYADAGLVWCTLKDLSQLLIRIDLEVAGIPISFVHRAQKFEYKVEFDNGTASPAEVRSHFLATVEADKAMVAAEHAKDAADQAAGYLPF